MSERCKNPACPDDSPELFSWLGSEYCSWNCQWTHKRALAEAAVDRIDEVIGDAPETPSSSTLPAEPVPSGVRVPITPSNSSAVVPAMRGAADEIAAVMESAARMPICREGCACHPPITHPAGVIPPEVEQEPDRQGLLERAIKRVFG